MGEVIKKYTVEWEIFGIREMNFKAKNPDEAIELAIEYIISNIEFQEPAEGEDD